MTELIGRMGPPCSGDNVESIRAFMWGRRRDRGLRMPEPYASRFDGTFDGCDNYSSPNYPFRKTIGKVGID